MPLDQTVSDKDQPNKTGGSAHLVMLQVRDKVGVRARAPLQGKKFVIGRSPEAHVCLRRGRVSRKHAEIYRDEHGHWWVRDLGSSNGTLVNGHRIEDHKLDLKADRIHVGPYRLKLIDVTAEKEERKRRKRAKQQKQETTPTPTPTPQTEQTGAADVVEVTPAPEPSATGDAEQAPATEWADEDITIASEPSLPGELTEEPSAPTGIASATGAMEAPKPVGETDDEGPSVPKKLGNYEVLSELGRGGMGAVYLSRQLSLNRQVALKVMNPKWATDAEFLANFMREAYAAASLIHHNITQIYDIGADRGLNFFSMEYVDGQSLGEMARDGDGMDPARSAGFLLQAARGLGYAHDNGMIHRDVKPDNLLINEQGVVKVTDLGLVKTPESELAVDDAADGLTQLHVCRALGTPAYMSPEQARNPNAADERSDIYSLGCTLFRMVANEPLFPGKSALEVMTKHVEKPVYHSRMHEGGIPDWLEGVLLKMVEKDPDKRHQRMSEVVTALRDAIRSVNPMTARDVEDHTQEAPPPRRSTSALVDAASLPGLVSRAAVRIKATRKQPPAGD